MKTRILSNMDGKLIKMKAVGSMPSVIDSPETTVYNSAEGQDEFLMGTGAENDEFSFASGKKSVKKKGKRSKGFFKDTIGRMQDRGKQKELRKMEEAKAQQIAAKGLADSTAGDIAMANALAKSSPTSSGEKKGMSTGAKIGIAVGIVAVLGIIGFVVYKKMKAGKK